MCLPQRTPARQEKGSQSRYPPSPGFRISLGVMKKLDSITGFPALFLSTQGVVHRSGEADMAGEGCVAPQLLHLLWRFQKISFNRDSVALKKKSLKIAKLHYCPDIVIHWKQPGNSHLEKMNVG